MSEQTPTLNDPRRIPVMMRIRLSDVGIEVRKWYRTLRLAGFSRHDANMIVAGAVAVTNPDAWLVERICADLVVGS